MKRFVLALCVLGAGCLPTTQSFGSGMTGAHPPPLPPGASVPKWDHFCSIVAGGQNVAARYLDEASENGWELVSWSISDAGNLACFKRPRVAAAGRGDAPPDAPAAGGASAGH